MKEIYKNVILDDGKSYNDNLRTNYFKLNGYYTIQLVGQRRLLHKRSDDQFDLSSAEESSLLALINHSKF